MSNIVQCRFCLKDSAASYSEINEYLRNVIESITSIKIEEVANFPLLTCEKCLNDINFVSEVRCRIIESDKIIKEKSINELEIVIKTEVDSEAIEEVEVTSMIDINEEIKEKTNHFEVTNSFCCTYCGAKYMNKRAFLNHVRRHKNQLVEVVCTICRAQIKSCNFKKHMAIHKGDQQICELCGAIAKNSESLRGHMFYMHKNTAEQYKCKQCDRCFRYKYKFKLHIRKAHGGDRTNICEICGKAFFTVSDVNKHIQMTHMKLRPYICEYCHKGFSSPYAKTTHVRQHTNERPFKCEICAEGFRQRVSLKTHLRSKHFAEAHNLL